MRSLPTLKRGWRLARPFETPLASTTVNNELLYVKLSDLEKLAEAWAGEMPYIKNSNYPFFLKQYMTELEAASILQFYDKRLLHQEIYISPDLYVPVFSWITYLTEQN